jgi:hypothetical protein
MEYKDPYAPDWWLEKFPHTYTEYKAIKDAIWITVYFKLAGKNTRLDMEYDRAQIEVFGSYEEMFKHFAMEVLTEVISFGDQSEPPFIYGHLVWDDDWRDYYGNATSGDV